MPFRGSECVQEQQSSEQVIIKYSENTSGIWDTFPFAQVLKTDGWFCLL